MSDYEYETTIQIRVRVTGSVYGGEKPSEYSPGSDVEAEVDTVLLMDCEGEMSMNIRNGIPVILDLDDWLDTATRDDLKQGLLDHAREDAEAAAEAAAESAVGVVR